MGASLSTRLVSTALLGLAMVAAPLRAADATDPPAKAADTNAPARGADELYWVPTLEQAVEMAEATGRPIVLMGYSLVGNGSTYTKVADDYCTGVY